MISPQIVSRLSARKNCIQVLSRSVHRPSGAVSFDYKWRLANRLTKNTNKFGPLTNMQDFSYKDGRPAPFGVKQLIRINQNRMYLDVMKKLSGEIDRAIERHAKLEQEKALEKQRIIDSKLKPKGYLMS